VGVIIQLLAMPTNPTQVQTWCFTLNNYTPEELNHVRERFANADVKYACFQREVGEEGTPHLQGYVYWDKRRSLAFCRKEISGRCHFEQAKGTPAKNREYCSKEGGFDFFESGLIERLGPGKRTDLYDVADAVTAKRSIASIAAEFPVEYIKYSRGIQALTAVLQPKRSEKTVVYWYYGATGTGKTRHATELAPDAYTKMGGNKWWDGYDAHEDVIIDDYRRDLCTFSELLRLFDRYSHRVEIKGGSVEFVAKRLFVTTPKGPAETWEGRTEEDLAQLLRRVDHIVHFAAHAFNPYN